MTNERQPSLEQRDLSWSLDDTTVDATVQFAREGVDATGAGVVFIGGSGPTDRDWNTPLLPGTNGSARLLAEVLAQEGITSIRYDKRAAGVRARENMPRLVGKVSMQSHLDELAGAVRALAAQPGVRRDRLFAVANSEGTLHALHYQLQRPELSLAGLVLIAPPGRSVGAVARAQIAAQLAPVPGGEAILAMYDAAIARFLASEPVAPDPALPPGIAGLVQGLASPANLPFSRELWLADSAPLLRDVNVPVLVVIGEKDVQVDVRADGGPLQLAAAGREQVTFAFPPDANHVLKHETRPRAELTAESAFSYNAADAVLDPEGVATIVAWLRRHVA
ncbi:MAG: alpha/beta hydrolase [Gemmatimonadaceae bacterium]|nr:alpha/beta hydrolase [Gemmatimonadaceae bacterium]